MYRAFKKCLIALCCNECLTVLVCLKRKCEVGNLMVNSQFYPKITWQVMLLRNTSIIYLWRDLGLRKGFEAKDFN